MEAKDYKIYCKDGNLYINRSRWTQSSFKAGAKWQKENLWKPADGEDLPEMLIWLEITT